MIRNLKDELFAITGQKQDSRFSSWAKEVRDVDKKKKGAFMFVGPFVNDGTIEVSDKPHLFLVASIDGSRKYQKTKYNVVKMNEEGKLVLTNIEDDNSVKGWEFRIQAQVEKLLDEISPSPISVLIVESLATRIQSNLKQYTLLKNELNALVKKRLESQDGFGELSQRVQAKLVLDISEALLFNSDTPSGQWDDLLKNLCKTAVYLPFLSNLSKSFNQLEEIKGEK